MSAVKFSAPSSLETLCWFALSTAGTLLIEFDFFSAAFRIQRAEKLINVANIGMQDRTKFAVLMKNEQNRYFFDFLLSGTKI